MSKILEAYDKDNDVHIKIAESNDIAELEYIGVTLWKNFNLSRKDNHKPIDWLQISDAQTKQCICFLYEENDKMFWLAS